MNVKEATAYAEALAHAIYAAWNLSLGGGEDRHRVFNQMKTPKVGSLVMETSTYHGTGLDRAMARDSRYPADYLNSVGWLEEIAEEKVKMEWNEATDGPHPTEIIYYIRTLDGRRFRWENASIVNAPNLKLIREPA